MRCRRIKEGAPVKQARPPFLQDSDCFEFFLKYYKKSVAVHGAEMQNL